MVMKDKLQKNHHKGAYYSFRRFLLATVAFFLLSGAIAVPTYIVQSSKAKKIAMYAEENSSEVLENNSEESETY